MLTAMNILIRHSQSFSLFIKEKPMDDKLLMIIAAVFLPPLAVFLKKGAGKDFLINLVLSLFFFLPGVIHALWLVTK